MRKCNCNCVVEILKVGIIIILGFSILGSFINSVENKDTLHNINETIKKECL